ncbi:MAG: SGNH/GDSL hydrolase family protein [Kiritimatiellae bacterium]|nr:SGNH/GDSL hydrolase family protein [Kiritimatiellia bacterium]
MNTQSKFTRSARPALSATLVLLDLLAVSALLAIPLAWLLDPFKLSIGSLHLTMHWGLKPALAPVVLLAARGILKTWVGRKTGARGLWETQGFKKLIMALVSVYLIFALVETVLTRTNFNAELPPIVFQGQNNAGGIEVPHTTPDAELLFRLTPGTYFQGRLINSMGFREREVAAMKNPGTMRVVCMGDSITGQGRPGYSQYLHERLTNNPPTDQPWEAFNIGVHGYSALQGLRQFQKMGRRLEPDIVTLYFGWNDHWLSEEADRQKMGLEMRPVAGRIFEILRKKRFFRFFIWAMGPVQHIARREKGEDRVFRVPPEEYHSTLMAFVREIRAAGAVPVIITAPRRSLTGHVVDKQYVRSIEEGNQIHDQYTEITREAARQSGAELLDLAAIFAGKECNGYFAPDGIHFDQYVREGVMEQDPPAQPGLARIAEEIDKKIRMIAKRK